MRLRRSPQQRLLRVREELARERARLGVLDEQLVHVRDTADAATTDDVVRGTLADGRERSAASADLRRAQAERDACAERIAALVAQQDELLEQLLEG